MNRRPAACFDFDGTLAKTRSGQTFAKHPMDWQWLHPNVPQVLQNISKNNYRLIIFSNQRVRFKAATIKNAVDKLGVPMEIFIAFEKERKKPNKNMYNEAFNGKTHPEGSFYVGDALGRPGDWSDVDLKFAKACGLPVCDPETFFGIPPN